MLAMTGVPDVGRWSDSWGTPVTANDNRIFARALLLGLIAAAIGLSACGRKGPLEPPPYAAAAAETGDKTAETAPPKPDKDFILDPLLD